jgi:hypothetical protein
MGRRNNKSHMNPTLWKLRPVRLAYQPPANSTFLSEQTSHQQPARTSQQYSSLRINQHQPSAISQNKLFEFSDGNIYKNK